MKHPQRLTLNPLIIDYQKTRKNSGISNLESIGQFLQNGSGEPVSVQSQGLQVWEGGQSREQQEERLVRQLGEAQLQIGHGGSVALEVGTETFHVPGCQRDPGQIQGPAGQRARQHRLQAAQTGEQMNPDSTFQFEIISSIILDGYTSGQLCCF